MQTVLTVSGFVLLLAGLWYLYLRVQSLVDTARQSPGGGGKTGEALQSMVAGLQILLVSLVLALIHLPLLYTALLAMAIMYSATRVLRHSLEESVIRELSKDLRFGILVYAFGMFLMTLSAVPGVDRTGPATAAASTPPDTALVVQQTPPPESSAAVVTRVDTVSKAPEQAQVPAETDTPRTCTVRKMGYVRTGPSRGNRIKGLSVAGSEARILKQEGEYYEVSGKYLEGKSGKGPVREGTYWIGEVLLNLE